MSACTDHPDGEGIDGGCPVCCQEEWDYHASGLCECSPEVCPPVVKCGSWCGDNDA